MHTALRFVLFVLGAVISFHLVLSLTHPGYNDAISNLISQFSEDSQPQTQLDQSGQSPIVSNESRTANATFVVLCRNSDVDSMVKSVREVEDRFNRRYHYPWVFLNDEPFTDVFKKRISVVTDSTVEFGRIGESDWNQPDWIDEEKALAARKKMEDDNIIYGGSVSYRNMCRFNSGFFFKHPLLHKYRYYWRVEPGVHFHCDVDYDPFLFLQDNNKTYGFTISMYEFRATIPTLWDAVKEFTQAHPEYVARDSSMGFLSEDGGETYNLCHFWSNFEIADMDFWRGDAYTAFFQHLESKGGFYYERWGDAPVHSIAAALFAPRSQIHWFDDIGYEHAPYTHCPTTEDKWRKGRCSCDMNKSFDYDGYSCLRKWESFMSP